MTMNNAPYADDRREPARILLVDDRPDNLLALEAILGSLGQTLVRAASGEEALKEDRDKCIVAGASDYLPKPVDTDKLLQLIRLWAR